MPAGRRRRWKRGRKSLSWRTAGWRPGYRPGQAPGSQGRGTSAGRGGPDGHDRNPPVRLRPPGACNAGKREGKPHRPRRKTARRGSEGGNRCRRNQPGPTPTGPETARPRGAGLRHGRSSRPGSRVADGQRVEERGVASRWSRPSWPCAGAFFVHNFVIKFIGKSTLLPRTPSLPEANPPPAHPWGEAIGLPAPGGRRARVPFPPGRPPVKDGFAPADLL